MERVIMKFITDASDMEIQHSFDKGARVMARFLVDKWMRFLNSQEMCQLPRRW